MKGDDALSRHALLERVSSARIRLGALRLTPRNDMPGLAEQMEACYAELLAQSDHISDEVAAEQLCLRAENLIELAYLRSEK